MLRAEFRQLADRLTLKLEGRLVSDWANQVKSLVREETPPATRLVVDLTEVTYIDAVGESVLIWLSNIHAQFAAETCYTRDVCERLRLTLEGDP
jgi:anti-anti-sigma regulatory factor